MSIPVGENIEEVNSWLEEQLKSPFWWGDKHRFGANGSQEGLFILANPKGKETWFSTQVPTAVAPFEALIEVEGKAYPLGFDQSRGLKRTS